MSIWENMMFTDTAEPVGRFFFGRPRKSGTVMASGKVKWFNNKKGFGFITEDSGQDVLCIIPSILGGGYKTLNEGEVVTFEAVPSDRGLKAHNVQRSQPPPERRRNSFASAQGFVKLGP